MDKIKLTKEEFNELYEVIEPDTPQPDLDKLKTDYEIEIEETDKELEENLEW